MKNRRILIITFLLTMLSLITNVFAIDYNTSTNVSVITTGGGSWHEKPLAMRISILDKNGTVKEVKRVLSLQEDTKGLLCQPGVRKHYFNSDNNPKISADSSKNAWAKSADYICTSYLPSNKDWYVSGGIFNLDSHLKSDNYSNLRNILAETGLKNSLAPGDYIIVEPMTRIGDKSGTPNVYYFGTAYELSKVFSLEAKKNKCTKGTPCYMYSKAVFGGSTNNQTGGLFFTTIYLKENVKIGSVTLKTFSPNAKAMASSGQTYVDERNRRNACFKDKTCGRGIGVYEYDKIYKLTVVFHSNGATNIKYKGETKSEDYLVNNLKSTINYKESYPNGLRDGNNSKALYLTKTGYTFTGYWHIGSSNSKNLISQKESGTGEELARKLGVTDFSSDKTVHVYAQWNKNVTIPKYKLDLNYCIDGNFNPNLYRYPKNYGQDFSYDFTVNGKNSEETNYPSNLDEGTKYEISNIVVDGDYEYLGYNYSSEGSCQPTNPPGTNISETLTQDTSINLIFGSDCNTKLKKLKKADGTYEMSQLIDLYQKEYENPETALRDLLDVNNPSCSNKIKPSKEMNLSCLSASTLSHENFNETNLTQYDQIIYDKNFGLPVGFCLTSMNLTNNLNGISHFYSKSGQFLIKQYDNEYNNSEFEIYDSSYNSIKIPGKYISTATTTKVCYVLSGSNVDSSEYFGVNDVQIRFGNNNNDSETDILIGDSKPDDETTKNNVKNGVTTSNDLVKHEYVKEIGYKLNPVSIQKMTGKIVESGDYTINGIISKFNSSSGEIPFEIDYAGYVPVVNGSCEFNSQREIIQYEINEDGTLELEFRTVDTNNPFNNRTPNSNWNDGSNKGNSENSWINQYILNAPNSYGVKATDTTKQTPKYKIKLTSDIINDIRAYNSINSYDNYEVCEENDCKSNNKFISDYIKKGVIQKEN